jgi:hypothetical protein
VEHWTRESFDCEFRVLCLFSAGTIALSGLVIALLH